MEIDVFWGLPKPLTMGKKSILIFMTGTILAFTTSTGFLVFRQDPRYIIYLTTH